MVRTWATDDPKAALMARKRAQIVAAARTAFLGEGYAASSVNKIADDAGVSIKTLYRHFETKDELFTAVIAGLCAPEGQSPRNPAWYNDPPEIGLVRAGEEYLRHVLSGEQLALYRIVAHDVHRFPELGRIYRREVLVRAGLLFVAYLDRWRERSNWRITDEYEAAAVFGGLLKAGLFDQALLGGARPDAEQITRRARHATDEFLTVLAAGCL
ncbi:TetR/AcrR family transcriptional regulator [Nocardia alba]|uniref:TetR family transcriptional regulator n=1 Tax=Nocardia alba TaxID=225051 RepID=A0A4R1G1D2_9NOCA|nr:TetR/AcrR family transcriptional regulator [Nocardia alba]TCJ97481.1 TetR family transcriptional regulator [Nocardia alba]